VNCDISFTFTPLGSSRVPKQAKTFKELEFPGLARQDSAKIEQTSKNRSKTEFLEAELPCSEHAVMGLVMLRVSSGFG